MDWKVFLMVFGSMFIAELGDKSQLAAMLFAAQGDTSKVLVFVAAATALVLALAISVAAGTFLASLINPTYLKYAAGLGFIGVGLYTLYAA